MVTGSSPSALYLFTRLCCSLMHALLIFLSSQRKEHKATGTAPPFLPFLSIALPIDLADDLFHCTGAVMNHSSNTSSKKERSLHCSPDFQGFGLEIHGRAIRRIRSTTARKPVDCVGSYDRPVVREGLFLFRGSIVRLRINLQVSPVQHM